MEYCSCCIIVVENHCNFAIVIVILCFVVTQLFKCFNKLGLCQGSGATRKNVDMFVREADSTIFMWKDAVQSHQCNGNTDTKQDCTSSIQAADATGDAGKIDARTEIAASAADEHELSETEADAGSGGVGGDATGNYDDKNCDADYDVDTVVDATGDATGDNMDTDTEDGHIVATASAADEHELSETEPDAGSDDDDDDDDDIDADYAGDTSATMTADEPDVTMDSSEATSQTQSQEEKLMNEGTCRSGPTFSIVWDNTQKLVQARHQSRGTKNKMLLWANAYAALNRVDIKGLDEQRQVMRAADIPLSAYLPSNEDRTALRERMAVIVGRILVENIPFFSQYCRSGVIHHVSHRFTTESAVKTDTVCVVFELLQQLSLHIAGFNVSSQ